MMHASRTARNPGTTKRHSSGRSITQHILYSSPGTCRRLFFVLAAAAALPLKYLARSKTPWGICYGYLAHSYTGHVPCPVCLLFVLLGDVPCAADHLAWGREREDFGGGRGGVKASRAQLLDFLGSVLDPGTAVQHMAGSRFSRAEHLSRSWSAPRGNVRTERMLETLSE